MVTPPNPMTQVQVALKDTPSRPRVQVLDAALVEDDGFLTVYPPVAPTTLISRRPATRTG